jgi:hypothetical protein
VSTWPRGGRRTPRRRQLVGGAGGIGAGTGGRRVRVAVAGSCRRVQRRARACAGACGGREEASRGGEGRKGQSRATTEKGGVELRQRRAESGATGRKGRVGPREGDAVARIFFFFFFFLRKGWKGLGGVWIRWAGLF